MRRATRRAAALLLLAAACAAPEPAGPAGDLRVMTYNIHHGEGTDGVFDLERIAAVIRAERPHLVALQEVDVATRRSSGVDQATELGRLTGMAVHFGKAMDWNGGQYGEAVLSRWPVLDVVRQALPHSEGAEPRCALWVRVQPPDGPPFWFGGTHLDHVRDDADRFAQARALVDAAPFAAGEPSLLAGDFNATEETRVMQTLFTRWRDAAADTHAQPTMPSDRPRRRIDAVLHGPEGAFLPRWTYTIHAPLASDHAPVVAVFERSGLASSRGGGTDA